jgi:hypothetical protein
MIHLGVVEMPQSASTLKSAFQHPIFKEDWRAGGGASAHNPCASAGGIWLRVERRRDEAFETATSRPAIPHGRPSPA